MKVNLTLDDLQALAAHSKKIGTQNELIDVVMEWAFGAEIEIKRLRAELRKGENTITEGVFNELLVHGFDNDAGAERILRQYLRTSSKIGVL